MTRNGDSVGLITPDEVNKVDRENWSRVFVGDVMRPLNVLPSVTPVTSASEALRIMNRAAIQQLPVIADGHLDGVITIGEILQLLTARAQLKPQRP